MIRFQATGFDRRRGVGRRPGGQGFVTLGAGASDDTGRSRFGGLPFDIGPGAEEDRVHRRSGNEPGLDPGRPACRHPARRSGRQRFASGLQFIAPFMQDERLLVWAEALAEKLKVLSEPSDVAGKVELCRRTSWELWQGVEGGECKKLPRHPPKTFQAQMPPLSHYERGLHALIREGRGVPAAPLVLIDVAPGPPSSSA